MPDTIELRQDTLGARQYLHGRPISDGALLDLWLEDGTQIRGRFEQQAGGGPALVLWLRGGEHVSLPLPSSARLSWPDARDGHRVEKLEAMLARGVAVLRERGELGAVERAFIDEAQRCAAKRDG